ncbi:MAG: iron-containing alcohol dehydrogenase [Erysipelotrichaceae bacterium]|jgi:alcohol dehydrogenase class IV|nr:iron-containing alcohol dehydrogenase [Erysipelotrichaceae bacterium]
MTKQKPVSRYQALVDCTKFKAHPLTPFYRIYQWGLRIAMCFVKWPYPKVLKGDGCLLHLPKLLKENNLHKALLVSDKNIRKLGLLDGLCSELKAQNLDYIIFDDTVANPTIPVIEQAYQNYLHHRCDHVIAIGGGSVIDCAKVVCAKVAKPEMTIQQMRGLRKIHRKLPPLYAIPTTSGSGSESSLAAVVVDPDTKDKYAINDPCLFPVLAVLDPQLCAGLPANLTAWTGMDALTHAIEAYLGHSNTKNSRRQAKKAVRLIFENLRQAYEHSQDLDARMNMQEAALAAGAAFTRAFVGNIHAIAHTLGGFYNTPHGLANAVILPYVLDSYGPRIYKRLAELAKASGLQGNSNSELAQSFLLAIRQLNEDMKIPRKLEGIKSEDLPSMCQHALKEANPTYPVPLIYTKADFVMIYEAIRTGGTKS